MKNKYPEWVLKHKTKGVAIEKRGEKYYASRVKSIWDPKKKRAKKITLEYLGVLSTEGIIPSKSKQPIQLNGNLDAGNIALCKHFADFIVKQLKEFFPRDWENLIALASLKLSYLEKLNRLPFRYNTSIAKKFWPNANLSKNNITKILKRIGTQENLQNKFFTEISKDEKHMAIDLSQLLSYSKKISLLEKGYNHNELWIPQTTLLLLWGISKKRPGYLKVFSGATNSAQTITEVIKETKLNGVTAVLDKGFWSKTNQEYFDQQNALYVMALKRDHSFIKHNTISTYKNYFRYKNNVQWYKVDKYNNLSIYTILDKKLAADEEATYLELIEQNKVTKKEYMNKKNQFGTISLLTNTELSAEETYKLYKERQSVEVAFNTLKNTLNSDRTWMQDTNSLRGYMFINFLALHIYSQIIDYLKRKNISDKSVNDVLTYLSKIQVVDINNKIHISPFTRQTKKVLDALELPITKNLGN